MLQRARLVGEWSEVLLKPTIGDPWLIAGPAGGFLAVCMALSLHGGRTFKSKVVSRGKRGCIKVVEEGVVLIAQAATTTWSCIRTLTLPLQNRSWNFEISDRGGDRGISLAWEIEILYQISK